MSKGDHVFNNLVSKLRGAFLEGLRSFLMDRRQADRAGAHWRASERLPVDEWLRQYAPRASGALEAFTFHHELVTLRNALMTSDHQGGDVNNAAYSRAAEQFEAATRAYFEKLREVRRVAAANSMLPEVVKVRRAFLRMTEAAEDPNARRRLLEEYAEQPQLLKQVQARLAAVDKSLAWAWARCEHLFRMITIEALSLGM